MKVEHWCNRTVVAAEADVGLRELAEMMRDYDSSQVVIVREAGTLVTPIGIVTDRDLALRALTGDLNTNALIAADIMSRQLLTVLEDDEIDSALSAMRVRGVHRAPVVDEEGAVVGILVMQEVLASMANMVVDLFKCRDDKAANELVEGSAVLYTLDDVRNLRSDPARFARNEEDWITFDFHTRSKRPL
jgi:CBS domain-containing protein